MQYLAEWEAGGERISYRQHSVFTRTGGKAGKPVLLLIHGFPTSSWDWHLIWETLCRHYRVIALDMTGFGLSDKPCPYDYLIADQADLIQYVLSLRGVTHYHILAHDYGDTVAQELLARQEHKEDSQAPEISSLIFLNGGLFPETHKPVFLQKILAGPLGPLLVRMNTYGGFRKTFDRICAVKLSDEELRGHWRLLNNNDGQRVIPSLLRYMQERKKNRDRWVGSMTQTDIPVRVINGTSDPISGGHMVERYCELVPEPDTVLLSGIGHYPQIEAPDRVLEAALGFWRQHGFITD